MAMETVGIFFGKITHRDATGKIDGMDIIFAPARRNAGGKLKTNHATNERIKKLETGYFPVSEAMSDDLWSGVYELHLVEGLAPDVAEAVKEISPKHMDRVLEEMRSRIAEA